MNKDGKQISAWRGEFGDAYVDRNLGSRQRLQALTRCFAEIFSRLPSALPASVLEVGSNVGNNLVAIDRLVDAELYAAEPNEKARKKLLERGITEPGRVVDAVATALPFKDAAVDLVFTSGVLIHIPPSDLDQVYREMHRVSARYVLSIEYFSQHAQTIDYRGEGDLLFKRDFGELWLQLYPALQLVGNGFFWKRSTGMDDLTWWLFRKP